MRLEELQLKYDAVLKNFTLLQRDRHVEFNAWKATQQQAIEFQLEEGKCLNVAAATALEEASIVKRESIEHRRISECIRTKWEAEVQKLSEDVSYLDSERRAFHAMRDARPNTDKVAQLNITLAEDKGTTRPSNTTTPIPILRHATSYPLSGPQEVTPLSVKKSVSFEAQPTLIEEQAAAPPV